MIPDPFISLNFPRNGDMYIMGIDRCRRNLLQEFVSITRNREIICHFNFCAHRILNDQSFSIIFLSLVLQMSLFGLGNPLLDISVVVDQSLLDKYELTCPNAILAEEKHVPLYKEITTAPFEAEYVAGGSAQNSIRVAQWMLKTPGSTAFAGCVGVDSHADTLRDCISKDGVMVEYLVQDVLPTGTCAVLVNHKDRSMVANLAAANAYKADHLQQEDVKAVWTKAKAYFVEGYFLTVSVESILTLAQHASTEGKLFGFSLSAPFICQFFTEPLLKVLEHTNLVFGNESEAEALGKTLGWEDLSPKAVAIALSKLPSANNRPRTAVVTCGPDDLIVAVNGEAQTFAVPKLAPEQIVDANGAGDAFAGAYTAGVLLGKETADCVRAGIFASQLILGTSGTKLPAVNTFEW